MLDTNFMAPKRQPLLLCILLYSVLLLTKFAGDSVKKYELCYQRGIRMKFVETGQNNFG